MFALSALEFHWPRSPQPAGGTPLGSWPGDSAEGHRRPHRGHRPHRQEETLSGSEDKEEAHLGSTVQHRNASVLSPKVHQNPKESDGHITDFQEGKVCQEEVHGFVQGRLKNMYYYYKTVSIKDNDVNDGEHPK